MRAPAGVVLDPLDGVLARLPAIEVHHPDPAFVAPAAMPHRDVPGHVASADAMAFAREGERFEGAAFPQVVVYGPAEMADTGGARLVGSDAVEFGVGFADVGLGGCGGGYG